MMKSYDKSVQIEINHKPNWLYNSDHSYRILIIGGLGSDKTNVLLKLNKTSTTRYWQKLFIYQKSVWIEISFDY